MIRNLRDWRERREMKAMQRQLEDTFSEEFGRPSERQIKRWENTKLHTKLVSNELRPDEQSMAERELDRRKAWEAPAGRALVISCFALAISIAALVRSFLV